MNVVENFNRRAVIFGARVAVRGRCVRAAKVKQVKSATCGSWRTVSESVNGNWKGGRTKHKVGYLMIRVPGHPRAGRSPNVFEHILVAESMLCRFLVPGETVHHLNGVRDDNRPENLELWTRPQPSGIRVSDAIQWARTILDLYDNEDLKSSPTMSEANLGHPWRCWECKLPLQAMWGLVARIDYA